MLFLANLFHTMAQAKACTHSLRIYEPPSLDKCLSITVYDSLQSVFTIRIIDSESCWLAQVFIVSIRTGLVTLVADTTAGTMLNMFFFFFFPGQLFVTLWKEQPIDSWSTKFAGPSVQRSVSTPWVTKSRWDRASSASDWWTLGTRWFENDTCLCPDAGDELTITVCSIAIVYNQLNY